MRLATRPRHEQGNHKRVITLERVETINLGAVLFALLILLWLAYALPRTAMRRDLMGQARALERNEVSASARDLSEAARSTRLPRETRAPMTEDRLLLRPADPTRRPRFDDAPGVRIDHELERHRSQGLLRGLLALLALAVVASAVAAWFSVIPWWSVAIAGAALGVYLLGLRRAEIERRNRAARAARIKRQQAAAAAIAAKERQAEQDAQTAARAQREQERTATAEKAPVRPAAPGEWTPRPVPVPTYRLRGEVEDLGSRHAAHRESVLGRPQRLEREDVEELEARDEAVIHGMAPAADLDLDAILARRRA